MATLSTKTIIYDNTCPMCALYTKGFIKAGVLNHNGRLAFCEASKEVLAKLDPNRARHEIPLLDTATGEVLYGLDGLTLIVSNMWPATKGIITTNWFKQILKPVYSFISYNRRIIANSPAETCGTSYAPDFNLKWRLGLIGVGMAITGAAVYLFSCIAGIVNFWWVLVCLSAYFTLLMAANLYFNKTTEARINYLAHLTTLGIIESAVFVTVAYLTKSTGLMGLFFAAHGACRLWGFWMHAQRVNNSGMNKGLNYVFAIGAIAMVAHLSTVIK